MCKTRARTLFSYCAERTGAGIQRTASALAWDSDQPPLGIGFQGFGWEERYGGWEEPSWVREAAHLLESGNTGRDWLALAKRLGKA